MATIFGGGTGKAEDALKKRKSRLDRMEEEATSLMPEQQEATVEPTRKKRVDNYPWDFDSWE
jgi:hypothetical protein